MKFFKKKGFLALAIALIAVLGTAATVYAAAGDVNYSKVGNSYVVDYVVSETTNDGITIQTIERKWIPENRFNPKDPRNPYPSNNETDRTQQLRNAGVNSRKDLQDYASDYQWFYESTETYATSEKVATTLYFETTKTSMGDKWSLTVNQVVNWNGKYPLVHYYIGDTEYTPNSIKSVFHDYGIHR